MAEPQSAASKALKKLEDQLTCAICLESYRDPKLLQCFHVFCEKCLVPLVLQDQQGQLSVRCPTCRQSTLLPAASVSGLQSAFHIHHLFEIQEAFERVKEPQNIQCQKCTKASCAATNYCRDCGQFICAMCTHVHTNWEEFSSHEVVSLACLKEDVTHLVSPKKVTFLCSKHKGKELELYCETCEELICLHCTVRLHQGHQYDLVNDTFEKHKDEITASLKPVENQLGIVSKALGQLDERCEQISDQRAAVEADIHQTFQRLHEALDLRRTELISELNLVTQQKMKALAAQRDEIETVQVQLKSCLELVNESLRMGSQVEVMDMKKPVVSQIKKLTADFKPDAVKPSEKADLKFIIRDYTIDIQQLGSVHKTSSVSPKKSYLSIVGEQTAVVEENNSLILHTVSTDDKPCVVPLENINCKLVSESSAKTKCSVKELENGQYEISYKSTAQGTHHLDIKVQGELIKGCPLTVIVKQPLHKRTTPTKIIDGLSNPWGVAVNTKGEIIVVESGKHCISIFSRNGDKLRTFGSKGSGQGEFQSPCGVAVDDDDNILVVDGDNHRIQKFRNNGNFIKIVGSEGAGNLQFSSPVGIAIHPLSKRVYVADRSNQRIQVLNPDLTFSSIINNCGGNPWDIAFDKPGKVFITDCLNRTIQVFTADGQFQKKFGGRGKGDGELDWPTSITIDSNNMVYVTESDNHRVSVFSTDGRFVTSYGSLGKKPGQFNQPYGIMTYQDTIVISSSSNGQVYIL